jgi:HK97 family phage portal protein
VIRAFRRIRQDLGIVAQAPQPDPGYGGLAAFVDLLRGAMTAAGVRITPERALTIPTVAACVRVHSEAVGRLPIKIYRRLPDGGKEVARDHPYYKLLKVQPNSYQTAAEWKSLVQTDIETYGNSYNLKIVIDGRLREILPIEAKRIEVTRSPSGETAYKVYDETGVSLKRTYTADSIIHFRGPFGNSLVAKSPSDQFRELFGIAYAIEVFIGSSFRNGIRPSVAFATDKTLSEAARANLENWLANDFAGSDKASIGMILDDGLKPVPFSSNNEEGQVAELTDKVDLKIARVFTMPPHMVGFNISQPRANMEQQATEYIQQGLGSRTERMEQRLNIELFDGGEGEFYCEFMYEDLLKGDPAVRAEFYNKLVTIGVMTRNEARARENLNPKPGGDDLLTPKNMDQGQSAAPAPSA